ncbi:MAG: 2-oxoacid:acceptor oxidoreductase family protein [Desulfobacteraceae bacterium]|nr:2-oxoacid:acceptor oxidoreductase family protein [Desulfobacteraceae bacterium]
MKKNHMKEMCTEQAGKREVLQGNIAFAVGCVRSGIHSADGYPGTPSTEVIDRGLSQVQDMIKVGWSTNEAVAAGVGFGQTLAGNDAVVTMKIPGLFQAADVVTSSAFFNDPRGALIYYVASDFTPSSTQHLVDPRYLFKSCFLPVIEPASHQDMLEAPGIAADIGRKYNTPVVILASGTLCHSEGLVSLNPVREIPPLSLPETPEDIRKFNLLPTVARVHYDRVMSERMPALQKMVEQSPLNRRFDGDGEIGIITYGANSMFAREAAAALGKDIDILSLGFTNPLPLELIRSFCGSIKGEVYVIEDGYRYIEESLKAEGLDVKGKAELSNCTEWSPELIAQSLGKKIPGRQSIAEPIARPPMICAGCPYRLFAIAMNRLKNRGKIEVAFGDIGCNALLYFMNAIDTGLAMGASESKRTGYSIARPDKAAKCVSVLGDSTECHSGMDATRNTVFRNVAGVKVVLDNYWTAMTGGQPAPSSPVNLAGEKINFNMVKALEGNGMPVVVVDAYDRKEVQKSLREALKRAEQGEFLTLVVRGSCINKVPREKKKIQVEIDKDKCDKCYTCLICPGIEKGEDGFPEFNNLCSGCGGNTPACAQMCPHDAMAPLGQKEEKSSGGKEIEAPPEIEEGSVSADMLPEKLSVAIRGVGGQGNLFFGRVLTQLAFLAGYDETNIVKGETHGMAQLGGPVISTFSCGRCFSPVLMPKSADCLICMEASEILRPGFLDLLKDGGKIFLAKTRIVPNGVLEDQYPDMEKIKSSLTDMTVCEVDVLGRAIELGDPTGRVANVVMMGVLSQAAPFNNIPAALWLKALQNISPTSGIWAANHKAFTSGREMKTE